MINTLITIKDAIQLFVEQHEQLKSVVFEADDQRANYITENNEFPLLFVAPMDVNVGRAMNTHTLRIYVYERVNHDRTDVWENANDTSLILRDIRVWWNDYGNDDIHIIEDPIGQFGSDRELDKLIGYFADMRFEIPSHGRCDVPINVTPTPPIPPCQDAAYVVEYADGTPIESGTIPSGGSVTVVVPNCPAAGDVVWTLFDTDGNVLDSGTEPSGGTLTIVAPDVTFSINGIEVATIPSGDTGSIQVLQGGLEVGALSGGNWIVPECEVCEDGTVTVNRDGVFFADVPVASGGTATINVPSNCPPVAPLSYFEMVVKTDNTGVSASNQFKLQFNGSAGVQIDWGDGTTEQYVFNGSGANSTTKTYATAGTYTIRLYGWWVRLLFFQNDANKVLSVNNWGVNVWGSMLNSFRDTFNLALNATDAPNLGTLTTMVGLFRNSSINANIGHWILPATLTTMDTIFQNTAMNAANYTDTLVAWILQVGAPNNVNAGNQTSRTFDSSRPAPAPYFTAGAVRTFATTPVISGGKGWTISGDTVI